MIISDETNIELYKDLHALMKTVPRAEKPVSLGDFSIHVGTYHAACEGVLGPHRLVGCSDNGLLFLHDCTEHRLLLASPFFRLPT
ncbi:hypothetical protein SprV_0200863900 [Sparganum proliferum]